MDGWAGRWIDGVIEQVHGNRSAVAKLPLMMVL
jgi:hypothetical protein